MTLVAEGDAGRQIVRELEVPVAGLEEAADQGHALVPQRAVVERVAAAAAGVLQVGHEAVRRIHQRLHRLVQEAGLQRPPHDVAVAEPPRKPRRAAAGHDDIAPGLVHLLGDLERRLPGPDDEHAAVRERIRVPVPRHVELRERVRHSHPPRRDGDAGTLQTRARLAARTAHRRTSRR